ncbi:MAG: autotransporter domain-containing protein [Alphaproteobacteria bacterium]|nr:autotransporter domain-containing protein [Alphaproteobacteria bacterium]
MKGEHMSNIKHLADLVKVCSILPALAIMPAMADVERIVTADGSEHVWTDKTVSNFSTATDVDATWDAGLVKVSKGSSLTIEGGQYSNIKSAHGVWGVGGVVGQSSSTAFDASVFVKDYNGNRTQFKNNGAYAAGGAMWLGRNADIEKADFIGNSVYGTVIGDNSDSNTSIDGGGALFFGSSSIAKITDSDFERNTSTSDGGAIAMRAPSMGNNSQAKLDIFDAEFVGNSAVMKGGAIYSTFYDSVTERNAVYMKDTDFTGNSAQNGGAIYNDGVADKADNKASMKIVHGEFEKNTATDEGGAIFNKGNMTIVGAEFEGNVVAEGFGGAIKNNGTLVVEDSKFSDNVAYVNGAFATSGKTGNTTIKGGTFDSNHATADGGALGLYLDATVTGTYFQNNTAGKSVTVDGKKYFAASDANGGGALYAGQKVKATLTDVHFINNESGVSGGAVSARHNTSRDGSYLKFDGAEFTGNKAVNYGGALESIYDGEVYFKNTTFATNVAGKSGGAIYNGIDRNYFGGGNVIDSTNHGVFDLSGVNTFENNQAGDMGGAIFNDNGGKFTLAGTNTFTGNTANGLANDIHNMGTFTIASGKTTIDGGITGTGSFTVASSATFNIGATTVEQGEFVLNGVLGVDVLSATQFGKVDADEISGSGTVKLNVASVGTYNIFGANNEFAVDAGKTFIVTNNGASGIKVELKDAETLATEAGISSQAASVVSGLAQSGNANVQKISLAMQQALNAGDVETVEKETAKTAPTSKPVAQAVASSVQNQILTMAGKRMAAISPVGRNGGDALESAGVWVQGMFNKSKLADQFHGYTRGFAMGGDILINDDLTIGGGYSYSNADIHADARHTDVESNSIFVYGQYKPAEWYVNGTLTYTMSDYDEQTQMLGGELTAQFDVDAYGAQFMTGYDFALGLTPEVGIRYMHVSQDAYDNGFVSSDELDGDYLSGVAGVKYAFDIANDWGMMLRPELRAGVTYDFLSDANDITVVMPGAPAYVLAGDRLSRMGGEFGIGMTTEYRGVQVSLNYDLTVHEDYTSQTGMVKFRYDF